MLPLLLILNTMILLRLTILGLAGILELYGAPGSKSGFHRTGLDRSLNPVQSSPKRSLPDMAFNYVLRPIIMAIPQHISSNIWTRELSLMFGIGSICRRHASGRHENRYCPTAAPSFCVSLVSCTLFAEFPSGKPFPILCYYS